MYSKINSVTNTSQIGVHELSDDHFLITGIKYDKDNEKYYPEQICLTKLAIIQLLSILTDMNKKGVFK